jgi:hypothetical protein
MGSAAEALADPAGARYLCTTPDQEACTHDHSMQGTCISYVTWEDFDRIEPVRCACCAVPAVCRVPR